MTQKDFNNYSLLDLATSSEDFSYILNTANEKYNNSMWKSFTDILPPSRSKKFQTIVDETGITVKASVLGPNSKKPLRSFESGNSYVDTMVPIGHGFTYSQIDLNDILELNLVNDRLAQMAAEKYLNRTENMIGGFHAVWNGYLFQAIANQSISLKNIGGGAVATIDLRTPSTHKLKAKGDKGWFESGTTAVIVDDLQRMNKVATDVANMPLQRVFICSKALLDQIVTDAGVLAGLKASMPLATSDTFISRNKVLAMIQNVYDLPPIVAIDEKSRYESDGKPAVDSADFATNKISLVPMAKLMNMHNSPSNYAMDTNPNTFKSFTEQGLIGSIQILESEPFSIQTNFESWTFPTFKNPKWIVSLDSSAHSTTGE